jgi:hypothetical protein
VAAVQCRSAQSRASLIFNPCVAPRDVIRRRPRRAHQGRQAEEIAKGHARGAGRLASGPGLLTRSGGREIAVRHPGARDPLVEPS